MAEPTKEERKAMAARIAAHEAWELRDTIVKKREALRAILARYSNDPNRDCDGFKQRLQDLGLWETLHDEANK